MNKWFKILGGLMVAAVLAAILVGVGLAQGPAGQDGDGVQNQSVGMDGRGGGSGGHGRGNIAGQGSQGIGHSEKAGVLSDAEVAGILYMREEEKLARDVYLSLYETWGLRIFQNISSSEATHMDAVKSLIDRYDLADPAEDKGVGVFVDETLQGLYDQLVAEGSQSLPSALRVGAAIEEIDILDLEAQLAQTDQADIRRVYENLLKGSQNHLRSFVSTLSRQAGETYQPQHLDQAWYSVIISSERGRGRSG